MKKILMMLIVSVLGVVNVHAATVNVSLDCGSGKVAAGGTITCTIKATPVDFTMKGMGAKYSITNGTYESFTVGTGFTKYGSSNTASNGFMLNRETGATSQVTVGTLKVKAATTGTSVTVGLTDVEAGDDEYNTVSGSPVSKEIGIKSTVNTLDNLVLTANSQVVTLSPAFASNVTAYTATINADKVNITATKTHSGSTVTGTGSKNLDYGKNTLSVVVTSETGAKKTYTLTITRPDNREDINTLSTLKLSVGTLTPTFVTTTTSYKSTVDSTTKEVKITATLSSAKASFVKNYGPRTVDLAYGSNKILVKVKSEKGNIKTYTLEITRTDNRSSNNYLSSLTVESQALSFNKDKTEYVISVNNNVSKINVSATAEDSKATISGTGSISLKVGLNTINIVVSAEDGTKKTYVLKVTRLEKDTTKTSNTNLSSLEVTGYDLIFDPAITSYNLSLPDDVTTLPLNYVVEDSTSEVVVEGNESLVNGSVVKVIVTATDGTVKTYSISITKPTNNNPQTQPDTNKENEESKGLPKGALIGIISLLAIVIIVVVFVLVLKKRKQDQF